MTEKHFSERKEKAGPVPEIENEKNTEKIPENKEGKSARVPHHLYHHKDVNHGEVSFASGLNIYKLIWIFILGSVIGVVFETLFIFFIDGVWQRRSGMLYGPFNQIYGIGAVLFTLALYRFRKKNALIIFLASAVIGGVFEYVCSWVQQMVFGSVSWEYSNIPTNIGGRTNLFYAFGWGIMGLLFITHFLPFLDEMIERIPNKMKIKSPHHVVVITGKAVTLVLAVLLALDLALTALAVLRTERRDEGVPATNALARWLDKEYPDDVMRKKFPSMKFVHRLSMDNSELSEQKAADESARATESTVA